LRLGPNDAANSFSCEVARARDETGCSYELLRVRDFPLLVAHGVDESETESRTAGAMPLAGAAADVGRRRGPLTFAARAGRRRWLRCRAPLH